MKPYDFLIVGSGLYGSMMAYLLHANGYRCLVVDKRNEAGGNLYCEEKEGIAVHKYGPHIFHTDNEAIWDFVCGMVEMEPFTLNTLAKNGNELYNLPFNMNTFSRMWNISSPKDARKIIDKQKYNGEIHNLEEQALSLVGKDVYEKLIKGYTEKQWGRKCSELPAEIIKRLPVRYTYNNNYFNDRFQGIPKGGYNGLIEALLEETDVKLCTDYFENKAELESLAENVLYTGKIDEFFGYSLGTLEYRYVYWNEETLSTDNYQGNAVINYTGTDVPFTRVIEHKFFEPSNKEAMEKDKTVISIEYSKEWEKGMDAYYPVNNEKNNALYKEYKELADKQEHVFFGGRLADYKYYDMDDTIMKAFNDITEIIDKIGNRYNEECD